MNSWERMIDDLARAIVELVAALVLGVLFSLAMHTVAHAADCTKTTELLTGQTATCDGYLLPRATTERALKCADVTIPTMQADCNLHLNLIEAARAEQERIALAQMTKAQACEVRLQRALDSWTPPRPWYWHPAIVGPVALVLGGLAGWGAHALLR